MTATGPANLIKAQILVNLQALVTAGDLGAVIEQDINTDIFKIDFTHYPCAVLGTSNMTASWEFPQSNRRTYRFEILVLQLQDNLTGPGNMEDLRDVVALQFDDNVTLSGVAPLGVRAVFSEKMTYAAQGKTWVLFNVTIEATTLQMLTYNF